MQIEFGVGNGWLAAVEGMKRYHLATVDPRQLCNKRSAIHGRLRFLVMRLSGAGDCSGVIARFAFLACVGCDACSSHSCRCRSTSPFAGHVTNAV